MNKQCKSWCPSVLHDNFRYKLMVGSGSRPQLLIPTPKIIADPKANGFATVAKLLRIRKEIDSQEWLNYCGSERKWIRNSGQIIADPKGNGLARVAKLLRIQKEMDSQQWLDYCGSERKKIRNSG